MSSTEGSKVTAGGLTSSSRLLCSFCSSMRFCLSANSRRLCSSFCCCSSRCCWCRRCASDRSLLASWRCRKSRLRVDSPGTLMMELRAEPAQRIAMTSGAIQYGVPMNVFLRPTVRSNWADTPKSTENTGKHITLQDFICTLCRSLCSCDVLALDVSVDDLVLMEVSQALQMKECPVMVIYYY
ncbi:hypothetical protein EYF80_013258 [Liparis tanakae]|uniref:Uncharacterized protein n=1 Tax=Liparis tanakae TaxID=230148 RepID=A0A4Z2IGV6_9TELE|nr:hypothetical protein EYF80_013258 [Liparis tanakae]